MAKLIPLKQKHSSGCGPTSIKMVVDFFDVKISLKDIEQKSGDWKKEGMGNQDLVNALKSFGFITKSQYNSSWENIKTALKNGRAVIVSWMLRGYIGHFSVVQKINDTHIWLADPEAGKIVKFEKIIFLRLWFDYDDKWYPEKSSDIKLRWMVEVKK